MNKRYELDMSDSRHHTVVNREMRAAIAKFPAWPNDMLHALAIVGEEFGELTKDVLQFHYEPHKGKSVDSIRSEAIQTLCMLHRFLNSLDNNMYVTASCEQHEFKA